MKLVSLPNCSTTLPILAVSQLGNFNDILLHGNFPYSWRKTCFHHVSESKGNCPLVRLLANKRLLYKCVVYFIFGRVENIVELHQPEE